MRKQSEIIGVVVWGLALCSHAFASPYTSMAVPGGHNEWSTSPSMVLAADNLWVCTQTLSSASGEFKFAANGSWNTNNWGGDASISRVPASGSAPAQDGANLKYAGLAPGPYRFTFNDSTLSFQMEWAGAAPLPQPLFTNVALVGDFNGWTVGASSTFTNHTEDTNLWSRSINLEGATTFMLEINGTNRWGAASDTSLSPPVSAAYACGSASFTLAGYDPGTFLFLFQATNSSISILQTSTADVVSAMSALGNFIGTNAPPPNMVKTGSSRWESTHYITNNGTITLRFSGNSGARSWGATNATAIPLPASGSMATGLTVYANISGVTNGRYRITFDHLTGNYSFQRVYTTASGINLIQNPGFESTSTDGFATSWNGYQAYTKNAKTDRIPPHSGMECGAIYPKLYPDWTDYSSYSQDVNVESGKTYLASAWIRATPEWSASVMQIKIEWQDSTNGPVGGNNIVTFTPDTTWQYYSIEGSPPAGAAKAHVVILCSGAGDSGYLCVDDVEVRQIPPRTQTFDSWGGFVTMGPIAAPDGWSVTSGKVIFNIPPGRPPASVFISQYVEGTGKNKAVEIYNGTLSSLDLSADNYVLQQYNNGATTPSVTLPLSGTIPPGMTLVVTHPSSPTNFAPDPALAEGIPFLLTNKNLTFNGDDVLVLRAGTNILDRVGRVGTNAVGAMWNIYSRDRTLSRNPTIFTGTLSSVTSAFPAEEWILSPKDSFDDLGTHALSFVDPNEPYTPAGYSLLLNTNASLLSGELEGGIGDISCWYRTESATPPIDLSIETAQSADGPWTTNDILSGIALTNFHYAVFSVNSPNARYARFRHVNGGTNRFRLDEIVISPYSSTPRLETFTAWTLPAYAYPGTYSRLGWTISETAISTNSGSRNALLGAPASSVSSPPFIDGVGEVVFWASPVDSNETAFLLLQSSTDGGSNWLTQESFTITSAGSHSTWLYLTNNPSQIRLVFDDTESSGEVYVDDVEVRIPALYRDQNFNTWPVKPSYDGGTATHQGWLVNSCMVDSQDASDGNSARLSTSFANAWIQSPFLPDGIGPIRFRMNKTTSVSPVMSIEISSNALSWTPIATVTSSASGYTLHSFFYSDPSNHYVRFRHSAGNTITPVDDISLTELQPRPEVVIYTDLDPASPAIGDTPYIRADVVSLYGASILSVTGKYSTSSDPWVSLPMVQDSLGSYVSTATIPAQDAGTRIRHRIEIQYAGIGAAPGSTGYSTNLATSATFTNYVSSIPKGTVWINELSYYATAFDPDDGFDSYQDHEFIELCGVANTSVTNWTLQLALGADADVAKNGGSNVYASYSITHSFADSTNGFGFYVFGDSGLTKKDGSAVDRTLSTLVPASVDPAAVYYRNHLHDSRGVIRLLDENQRAVYVLSYNGSVAGATPSGTQSSGTTNSISLRGTGSTYTDFTWGNSSLTIGAVNGSQTLVPLATNVLAAVFHIPSHFVDALVVNTNMRAPVSAAHSDNMPICYGFSATNGYGKPSGILHYRPLGEDSWRTAAMTFIEGSQDSHGDVYSRGSIPAYTNDRGSTVEYVIETQISKPGILPTFLGDGAPDYERFSTLDAAKASPFLYTYSIPSIYATAYSRLNNNWIIVTDGNDPLDPFVQFKVYSSTSLFLPLDQWKTNAFTTTTDYLDQITFTVPIKVTNQTEYYRFDPVW